MASGDINFYKGKSLNTVSLETAKKEFAQCLQVENLNFLIGSGCSSYVVGEFEKSIPTMMTLAKRFFQQNPEFSVQGVQLVTFHG